MRRASLEGDIRAESWRKTGRGLAASGAGRCGAGQCEGPAHSEGLAGPEQRRGGLALRAVETIPLWGPQGRPGAEGATAC